jgi:hypothetical protein
VLWQSDLAAWRRQAMHSRDAGNFIAKAATQALMLVVEHGGDTMLPRIATVRPAERGEASQHQRRRKITKKYTVVR